MPFLDANSADINYILTYFTGGWESWLQVGLGLGIAQNVRGTFSREQTYYPGSGVLYDLRITPSRGASIYFEIKTQHNTNDSTTSNRYENDINKIKSLKDDFRRQNVIIAFSFSELSNPNELNNLTVLMKNPNYPSITAYAMNGRKLQQLTAGQPTLFWYSIN